MRVKNVIIAIVALAVAFSGPGTSTSSQNDGGSGGDAGNTLGVALQLASLGTIHGAVSAFDPVDWYTANAVDTTTPTCLETNFKSDYAMSLRASSIHGTSVHEVVAHTTGGRLGVATPGHAGTLFEVRDRSSLSILLPYTITAKTVELPSKLPTNDDGGSGTDASLSNPVPIKSGCTFGALQPNSYDTLDLYTFTGSAGKTVMLSMVSKTGAGKLTLLTSDGTALTSIGSGELTSYTLPTSGEYGLTMTQSNGGLSTYAIGLCEPECRPPGHPCNPMCVDMLRD